MKALIVALGLFFLVVLLPDVRAGAPLVTTLGDGGTGSLRAAIAVATDGDTIHFSGSLAGQTITLTTDELLIDKSLTIEGLGATQLTVKRSTETGTPAFRIFYITKGHSVTISGLTISNGLRESGSSPDGAGIIVVESDLTLTDVAISDNTAASGWGGAILFVASQANTDKTLTINRSKITGNSAFFGGGIYNYGGFASIVGKVILNDCTVSGNSAQHGGAIFNEGGSGQSALLMVNSSTISGNSASQIGGAIFNHGDTATLAMARLANSTISNNSAQVGGAITNGPFGITILEIDHCTISGNSQPAKVGALSNSAALVLGNTILKTGATGTNITNGSNGTVTSHGFNISDDDGSGLLTGTGDQVSTEPMLGPLQDNGGPTQTHALPVNSPAIDAGNPSFTPPPDFDQRGPGFARVFAGRVDVGSFEMQPVGPTPTPGPTATATPIPSPSPSTTPTPTPGPSPTATPIPTQTPLASLSFQNISTRLRVLTEDHVLIGGFIVSGFGSKWVIIRAIGPSLTGFGVPDALLDPVLELHGPAGFGTITNDNWRDHQGDEIKALGLAPTNEFESAIFAILQPGAYTALVSGKNGGTGIGLVEIYDLSSGTHARLANISTRGEVGFGSDAMIGGFILGNGNYNSSVLIRAIGPSLGPLGVSDALADPTLELHNGNGDLIAANDNWKESQQAEIEATGIPPSDDHESAIVRDLIADAYTAVVRGTNDTTGVALVEAYELGFGVTPTPGPTATPVPTATPTPTPTQDFSIMSARAVVGTDDGVMMNAFIITGSSAKRVLIRGLGPSTFFFDFLKDPVIELRSSDGSLLNANNNWRSDQEAEIIATGMAPENDLESAIVASLMPGSYTVVLKGNNNGTGGAVADLHDLSPGEGDSNLTAVGSRGMVTSDRMINGITVRADEGILIRALGHTLFNAGVTGVLEDPTLEFRDSNGQLIRFNNNWRDDPAQEAEIIATGLAPSNDRESAMFLGNLAPGNYATVVYGNNDTHGIAYMQFYILPHSGLELKLTP